MSASSSPLLRHLEGGRLEIRSSRSDSEEERCSMERRGEGYVDWKEIVVCKEKGRREVHYYLRNADGGMNLAVVGRERSARHMSYAVPARFLQSCGDDAVVRVPAVHQSSLTSSASSTVSSSSTSPPPSSAPADTLPLKWRSRREVIDWLSSAVSDSSLASNQLYELRDRADTCIADDFLYKPLLSTESSASSGLSSEEAETSRKRGLISEDAEHKVKRMSGAHCLEVVNQEQKSQRFVLTEGQLIEVLSQDSGLRGCWFCCVVLVMHADRIKVRYVDLEDADGSGPLEEWIRPPRYGVKDELGIRMQDRSTIRPQPLLHEKPCPSSFNIGTMVDAWWHDGWWEGVVVSKGDLHHAVRIYFPGEGRTCDFKVEDLRHSKEWCKNRWNSMRERPDLVSSINGNPELGDCLGHLKWNCSRKRGRRGLARGRKFSLPPPLMEDPEVCSVVVA